ncbi:MAG: 4Fe-4S binding protein, partial [Proteobacteria bacterium]|nr:4Fe-4S binding protein [Pseudomonadota bacterium]
MNARTKASNGSVVTNTEVCIGCRACMYICPVSGPAENPYTGQTMTCDMCKDDEAGPWCVTACQYEGALTMHENDSLTTETARQQAGRFRKIYS